MFPLLNEDISRRAVSLTVQATKLTAQVLAQVFQKALHEMTKGHTHQGKQSVRQLMRHGADTNCIPVDCPKLFDKVARKWEVDYAFYKTGPGKYQLFFRSGQADAITACFSEYSKLVLKRSKGRETPVLERLKQSQEQIKKQPQKADGVPAKSNDFVGRGATTEWADFGGTAAEEAERSLRRRKEPAREER